MTDIIHAGYASSYFITDAMRAIAISESPAVLFISDILDLKKLAAFIGSIPLRSLKRFFWKKPVETVIEPVKTDAAYQALNGILDDGRPTCDLPFHRPFLFFVKGITREALTALTIIKLRGCCNALVLDSLFGGFRVDDVRSLITNRIKGDIRPMTFDDSMTGYECLEGLSVVSGIKDTALSFSEPVETIIKYNPHLIRSEPISDSEAFFGHCADDA